jgi:subfamily B ATP-binding cassette protein MsbA
MGSFWQFAERLLRYRRRVAAAVVMAFVSAGGLGAGLIGLLPVIDNILGEQGAELPDLAAGLNERLGRIDWIPLSIPEAWIDALPAGRFNAVFAIVGVLGVLTVVGASANFLHAYLSLTVTARTVADIRRRAFHRLLHVPLGVVTGGHGADLISRVINDANTLSRGLSALTNRAVAHITKGAASLAAAFVVNWRLALITLAVAPVLAVVIRKTGKRVRRASRAALKEQAELLSVATEAMQGFRVVKVHGTERHELGRFTRHNEEVFRQQLRARTARAVASPLTEVIAILGLGALALIAAKAIIDGELAASEFITTLGALAFAGQSLKPLNAVVQDIQQASGAADRLEQLLAIDLEEERLAGRPRLSRHRDSIVLDGVRLTYPNAERPALDGVDLRVEHGQRVAVVGSNGSGKTTLLALIPRLFDPDDGRVLIDGTDVRSVSLRSLRKQIGVVTQETVLFRGTIAGNIAYGASGATRGAIERAASLAHADGFIRGLPGAYDAAVGDRGLTLSGGQRQRIAIARAILRDPAILIMDEATSMIDAESEALIGEAIDAFGAGRTCLVVAHRLSTVLNADRILVMEAGRVVDDGTHAELLERCGLYQGLVARQLQPASG